MDHVASAPEPWTGDAKTCDAVERCLERISEAATKLDTAAEQLAPSIPWPQIRGLGNRLRHGYDDVNPVRIAQIVAKDLQPLRTACLLALAKLETGGR